MKECVKKDEEKQWENESRPYKNPCEDKKFFLYFYSIIIIITHMKAGYTYKNFSSIYATFLIFP